MRSRQLGVSLIEVLITMLVLAFGVLALVRMQGYLYHSQIGANDYNAATTLAQNALERRHAGLSDLCPAVSPSWQQAAASGSYARFQCNASSTIVNASQTLTTINVQWQNSTQSSQSLSVSAMITH